MIGRTPHLSHEAARRLTTGTEPYLSCDECFDQIDGYVDSLIDDRAHLTDPLRAHLLGCAACGEEAWSLLNLVAADHGVSIEDARVRFEHDMGRLDDPPA